MTRKHRILLVIGAVALLTGCTARITLFEIPQGTPLKGYVYYRGDYVIITQSPRPPRGYEPLIYAEVILERGPNHGRPYRNGTDRRGYFIFHELPRGENYLHIKHSYFLTTKTFPIMIN